MRLEPRKEVRVLPGGQIACQKLVEMMVTVDQAGEENMAAKVEDKVIVAAAISVSVVSFITRQSKPRA